MFVNALKSGILMQKPMSTCLCLQETLTQQDLELALAPHNLGLLK